MTVGHNRIQEIVKEMNAALPQEAKTLTNVSKSNDDGGS